MIITREAPQIQAASEIGYIESVLASNSLVVRDGKRLARSMVFALQPLLIDNVEICTDTILAEFLEYATAEKMLQETATMTLKKAAFGAFEASLTPIPKYCFTDAASLKAILIHSIHRFTLDDIVTLTEKNYPRPYPYKPFLYYADWLKSVHLRISFVAKKGIPELIKIIPSFTKQVTPPPPQIEQRERKAFAYRILSTVERHHGKGFYHDRISERTIFFPTAYQPQLLSNYSGAPSSMLYDYLPLELMHAEAVVKYGPQCRDIYSLALICYRIMTGEKLDGRKFSLDAPRPFYMIFREIIRRNRHAPASNNFAAIGQAVMSVLTSIKAVAELLPPMFSYSNFVEWRKLNKATGGVWRSVPVLGQVCDILFPTRCARTLRLILDKHWFIACYVHDTLTATISLRKTPDISLLAAAFRVDRRRQFPSFETAFTMLNRESVLKRKAFGSMMETGLSIKRAYRWVFTTKQALFFSTAALVLIAPLFLIVYNSHVPQNPGPAPSVLVTPTTLPVQTSDTVQSQVAPHAADTAPTSLTSPMPETVKTSISVLTPDTPQSLYVASPPKVLKSVKKTQKRAHPLPESTAVSSSATSSLTNHAAKKSSHVQKETVVESTQLSAIETVAVQQPPVDTTPAAPAIVPEPSGGTLVPAAGSKNVFVVTGVADSCNPGTLFYSIDGKEATVMISRLPTAFRRLYLAHRTPDGFDSIIVIRLCRTDGCDPSMYYEPVGIQHVGKAIFVRPGDAISASKLKLWMYIRDKRFTDTK